MIFLYIYLGTVALPLIGFLWQSVEQRAYCIHHELSPRFKPTKSEMISACFKLLVFSIIPLLNLVFAFGAYRLVFSASAMSDAMDRQVQLGNLVMKDPSN